MKTSQLTVMLFLASSVEARHHHHHHGHTMVATDNELSDMETLNAMSTNKLVAGLKSTLDQALAAEARDDKAAAVAKTAAIKNIQKALTARILKRLDDGQPLVEVARKMKAIEGMQPQINDMERRLGIMQSVEPVLENAIKTLQKVVDVRGMGKKLIQLMSEEENSEQVNITDVTQDSIETAKAAAIAKSVKDGEDAMEKAAAAAEKANKIAVENTGTADAAKEANRLAKAAKKVDAGACKTCEKVPLTKEEKKEEELEKKLEEAEKKHAEELEKEKEEEEKKAKEDDSDDEDDAKEEKKEEKKAEKKDEKKDDAKEEKKDGKKGKGKGKGKGGKKEEKEEKKEEKKEEVKLDKDGKPICKGPAKEKDVQLEESDSEDEE